MKKILVRVPNWIGDAIMCTPAITQINKRFPESSISVLGRDWVLAVFEANPFVDGLIPMRDKKHFTALIKEGINLRNNNFDGAFIFTNSFSSLIPIYFAKIPVRVGYNTDLRGFMLTHPYKVPKTKKNTHEIYYYLNLIANYFGEPGILKDDESNKLVLIPSEKGINEFKNILKKFDITGRELIVINPFASYGGAKKWKSDRFSELSNKLLERYHNKVVLIVGAKKDFEEGEEILRKINHPNAFNLSGITSLSGLIALISHSRLFITNDSGPMHIGAALNIPMIAIFGSTNPITTGPLSENAKVIMEKVPCSPCFLRECPKDFICMESITVEKVFEESIRMLEV